MTSPSPSQINPEELSHLAESVQSLKESERRYRSMFEHATFGMFQSSLDGKIIDVNPMFLQMFGYADVQEMREDLRDNVANHYFHPEERQQIVSQIASQNVVRKEVQLRTKNGAVLVCMLNIWGARDEFGSLDHLEGFIEDITERVRAEEERQRLERQMLHAQKMESLGVLAGGIAHDFNNLLMGIMGNANLALLDLPEASPVRENIVQIEAASKRAAELCRQMLAYAGRGKFLMKRLSLDGLIKEMMSLLHSSMPKKIRLTADLGEQETLIEGDPAQVRQVVLNLVTNAAEAIGDEAGKIRINTGIMHCDKAFLETTFLRDPVPEGPYAYLEVSDSGSGMNEETISRSFDPFYSTKFPGRGLGLAAVMGIVQAHHGAVKVTSQEGHGTSIKVLFPAAHQPAAQEQTVAEQSQPHSAKGLILIIDDEETVRAVTRQMLERAGFRTLSAADGLLGVELFKQHKDETLAILLDMTMPNMDGVETFRMLKEIREDVKVILSSGYNEQDAMARFTGKGLSGFIQKPYGVAELLRKVRDVVGQDSAVGEGK